MPRMELVSFDPKNSPFQLRIESPHLVLLLGLTTTQLSACPPRPPPCWSPIASAFKKSSTSGWLQYLVVLQFQQPHCSNYFLIEQDEEQKTPKQCSFQTVNVYDQELVQYSLYLLESMPLSFSTFSEFNNNNQQASQSTPQWATPKDCWLCLGNRSDYTIQCIHWLKGNAFIPRELFCHKFYTQVKMNAVYPAECLLIGEYTYL